MTTPGRAAPRSSGPELGPIADVVVLRWPGEAGRDAELAHRGALRLLLVEPEADAPVMHDSRADWVRLPCDERDIAARVLGLARRHTIHVEVPRVDGAGRLLYDGQWVALSPIEARLASVLGRQFGAVVTPNELIDQAWPETQSATPATDGALRVHLSRLRKRVAEVGLEVRGVRNRGIVMQPRA